jgi:hypothetical protein
MSWQQGFDAGLLLAWIDEGGYFTGATTQPVCTVTPPANIGTPTAGNGTTTIEWIDASNNWVDIDVGQLPGTSNAVLISSADIVASGAVTGVRSIGSLTLRVTLTSLAGAPGQVGTVQYKVKNLRGELSGAGTISVIGTAAAPPEAWHERVYELGGRELDIEHGVDEPECQRQARPDTDRADASLREDEWAEPQPESAVGRGTGDRERVVQFCRLHAAAADADPIWRYAVRGGGHRVIQALLHRQHDLFAW